MSKIKEEYGQKKLPMGEKGDNKKVSLKSGTEEENDKEYIEKVKGELKKEIGHDSKKWKEEWEKKIRNF